jgi:hypothetical protein
MDTDTNAHSDETGGHPRRGLAAGKGHAWAAGNRCSAGCGYPVPRPGAVCGECAETGTP